MRGGRPPASRPKSEQSDLSSRSPACTATRRGWCWRRSIADCAATTQWAVELAETLQAPAHRAVGPVHGPVARIIDRPTRPARRAPDRRGERRSTGATATRPRCLADGDPRHAGRRLHRRRPGEQRGGTPAARRSDHPRSWPSANASSLQYSTTPKAGPTTSRATAIWRSSPSARPAGRCARPCARRWPRGVAVRLVPLRLLASHGRVALARRWRA